MDANALIGVGMLVAVLLKEQYFRFMKLVEVY